MTASVSIQPTQAFTNGVKVNVRLCGSVPRMALSMMNNQQQPFNRSQNADAVLPAMPPLSSMKGQGCATKQLCSRLDIIQQEEQRNNAPKQQLQPLNQSQHQQKFSQGTLNHCRRPSPTYEAPSWAVPASGEARLEPVCDSVDRQGPVDLSSQAVFRIGRSPQSDVQLMHVTSSRRHAMLFHHPNGSCYLVDCGSAHGTYINGIRVTSSPNEGNVVVPTRVRRGSIVRFGGPGAPSFMLKSFTFDLDEIRDFSFPSINACLDSHPATPILSAVVEHNTRFNSLGRTAKAEIMVNRQISSKRSYDSLETVIDSDYDDEITEHHHDRHPATEQRLTSPPLSPEQPLARLVSPELNCICDPPGFKRRRVTFSEENLAAAYPILVSPDVSSDEQEN